MDASRRLAWPPPRPGLRASLALLAATYIVGCMRSQRLEPMAAFPVPCDCAENARVLTVPAEVMPHKVAACVLQDRPTRGILHAGLGSCLGRSTWQPPPQGTAPARPAGRWDEDRGQPAWGEGAGTWQPDAQV